ncbi:MAG: hypothetical protein HZB51_09190 [Chloroflexi bacterium]|nr:hypothetical protein [Chloroflexota bacterium]
MLTGNSIPKFDPQIYTKIALNELVTYSVYFLSQSNEEVSTENIVAACFLMFPQRFALRGYAQWPDSTVVEKRWLDCRNRGLIEGSTARGFSLTPKGLELAEKVGKTLSGKRPIFKSRGSERVRAETRTRAGRFVRAIEDSDAFRLYQVNREHAQISEFDFRSMLLCTMESSASTLRNNLEQFRQYASVYERKDIDVFLDFCEKRFARLLTEVTSQSEQYQGGMMRRKIK